MELAVDGSTLTRRRAASILGRVRTRLPLAAAVLALASAAPARAAAPTLFPSDEETVADPAQLTGKRLALRLPDCGARPSDCNEIRLLNELDGFDVSPRIEIGFGTPIDVAKVTPDTVSLQAAGKGPRIGINRLVWSPARNALYGQPAQQLAEGTTYRLTVTGALSGSGAETTFTTMSATAGLRQMREQLDDGSAYDAAGIPPASRGLNFLAEGGARTVFPAPSVARIQRYNDTGKGEPVAELVPNTAVAGAGLFAFGSFRSPSWLTPDRVIPQAPTKTGRPKVHGAATVGFALIVPGGAKPADGWPVAVFGPGITRSKYDLFLASDENASRGIATIAIDPVGHAYGPRSQTEVDTAAGGPVRFSGFGRGVDLNKDGTITEQEGVQSLGQPAPLAAVGLRDGLRQTAADNMALVRAIGRGVDVDGDGAEDLRRTGITYYAQSLGGIYGTMLMGSDPLLKTGALNVPGGPILEIARLSPDFRSVVGDELKNRRPSVANGGREGFTESAPLWVDPPVLAPAQGAVEIQRVAATTNWIERPGSPEAFAPLIIPTGKRVIYQFAFGDQTVPNPTSATVMRAGGLRDVTSFYRNDRTPTASTNPHGFLLDPRLAGRNLGQRQIVDFLGSDGQTVTDPDGGEDVFEVPIADPLSLERLNFDVPKATGEPPPETPGGPLGAPRRGRLSVSVAPRRLRAGRRVRIRVRVRMAGRPVRGARIFFAGRRVRTNAAGRVVFRVRVRSSTGRRRLVVRVPGATTRKVTLRVTRRR